MKNTIDMKDAWKKQKTELKRKFAQLTNHDFMYIEGEKDGMFGKLQLRLGKTKEELHLIFASI